MEEASLEIELPGFRFHPTEEELVDFYLRNMLHGKKLRYDVIRFLDIYRHDPSELPGLARLGEREWYFYVPRDRKHGRPNRTTDKGFWKATGSDRKIVCLTDHKRLIGLRKTLVFYRGRAPRGSKTNWVMNEYRVPDNSGSPKDMVLCKIYQKATSLKVLEQRAAMEEAVKILNQPSSLSPSLPPAPPLEATSAYMPLEATSADLPAPPLEATSAYMPLEATSADLPLETTSAYTRPHDATLPASDYNKVLLKLEENEEVVQIQTGEIGGPSSSSSQASSRFWRERLPMLQVPRFPVADWTQDSFWTQFNSPCLWNLITTPHEHLELLG